jgi:hypothetical protein
MNEKLQAEFNFVKKVIKSCSTEEQLTNAKEWAADWAKKMEAKYPLEVTSWINLYLSVID